MFVNKIYSGFTGLIEVGKYSLFIETQKNGVFISNDEILDNCLGFQRVVFCGDNPFEQKEDVIKLIKKINQRNDKIMIDIYCNGKSKPMSLLKNVKYYVNFDINNKEYKDNVIDWFISVDSYFLFLVNSNIELEKTNKLISEYMIPKKNIFIISHINNINQILMLSIKHGYNFCPDFREIFDIENSEEEI
jgi:hypothetical protein